MANILCVIGPCPEAIRREPVILSLKNEPWANVWVLVTVQAHVETLPGKMMAKKNIDAFYSMRHIFAEGARRIQELID